MDVSPDGLYVPDGEHMSRAAVTFGRRRQKNALTGNVLVFVI